MNLRVLAFLLTIALPTGAAATDSWLQWAGPNGDFTSDVEGLAEWWPADGPTVLWKRPLGEGYSSIVSTGDRLFTMYRDGEQEVVVALDARSGETKWEHRYPVELWPEMTKDFGLGPNATPAVVGDRIVAIGIDGRVRCLDLATGDLLWERNPPAELGRRERDEEYGYSNSPLLYDGKIIVLVGGTDHAVVALDPADGSFVWRSAPGGISYAPAAVASLGGQDQLLYFSPEGVVALDPATGNTLWQHPIEYDNGNHLTPAVKCDDSHVWVGSQFATGGGRLLEVKRDGDSWNARRVWFEPKLRASHWTSIRIGNHIYGSTGGNEISLLTAFDWKTGEVAWRRRGFHKAQSLYVDGKLLLLDEDGQLTLAKVSPKSLEVLDAAQVTESVSWTLPTLVGTNLYVRDGKQILALDLADSGGARPPEPAGAAPEESMLLLGAFGEFIRGVQDSPDRLKAIDAFMKKQETFPILEGDSLAHFVFRGDVPDVAIMGNFLDLGEIVPLDHVEGTDFYFRSFVLPPGAHFEYRFNVFEEEMPDPLNPRRLTPTDEELSVVTTPGWVEPPHLREPEGVRGRLETFTWKSEILENEREISVYLPAGYDSTSDRYPVVVINYGNQALEQGLWSNSLDNLIGRTVAPVIAVFLPRVDFDEYAPRVGQFAGAMATELIPFVDERYRTMPGSRNRAMTGIASGGFASTFLALKDPELIGKVAVQSFYFRTEAEDELRSMIASREGRTTSFYLEWSTHDLVGPGELQCENASRELAALLSEGGYTTVTHEVEDGAGWGSWRARTDRILESFFPLED